MNECDPLKNKMIPINRQIGQFEILDENIVKQVKGFFQHNHIASALGYLKIAIADTYWGENSDMVKKRILRLISEAFPDIEKKGVDVES